MNHHKKTEEEKKKRGPTWVGFYPRRTKSKKETLMAIERKHQDNKRREEIE